MRRTVSALLILGVLGASPAWAQDAENPKRTRLMLGVAGKSAMGVSGDTSDRTSVSFIWRWRGRGSRDEARWSPSVSYTSYGADFLAPGGGGAMDMGPMKIRPVMATLNYKMPKGRWTWQLGVGAGWAINSLDVHAPERSRLAAALGARDVAYDIDNSLAIAPRVKGWYDLNRRVSFMVETSYFIARPQLNTTIDGVTSTRRLNADALVMKAGIVYGIF